MSTQTFAPFDSADYLNTFEDVTAYLEAVLEDAHDDPKVIAAALGAIGRDAADKPVGLRWTWLREAARAPGMPCRRKCLHGIPLWHV
ncbi:MAG: transcriptional regulator [Actinomycetales bacterium]|nr:transcriptional regulator [Actinomycetales bacterium]